MHALDIRIETKTVGQSRKNCAVFPMTMEQRDHVKLAEKMLESADSKGRVGWALFVSLFLTLLAIYAANIEPLIPKMISLWSTSQTTKESRERLSVYQDKLAASEKNEQTERERSARLSSLRNDVWAKQKAEKEEAAKISVAFSFPGIPEFKVSTRYAGLVSCLIVLGLLFFLKMTRSEVLSLYARAARLLKENSDGRAIYRPAVLFSFPWWLAPLPKTDGLSVTASEFRSFSGWVRHTWIRNTLIALLLLAICILQLRVAAIAVASLSIFDNPFQLSTVSVVLVGVTAATVISTVLIAGIWFRNQTVPDRSFSDSAAITFNRRQFFTAIAVLSASVAAVIFTATRSPKSLTRWMRSPRFRAKPKPPFALVKFASGLYVNRNSGVVQYAIEGELSDESKTPNKFIGVRTSSVRPLNEANYTPFEVQIQKDGEANKLLRANKRHKAYILELVAIRHWEEKRSEEACRILYVGILEELADLRSERRETPSFRNYYLLARYALISEQLHWLAALTDAVNQHPCREVFQAAIHSWHNENSRWRKNLRYLRS